MSAVPSRVLAEPRGRAGVLFALNASEGSLSVYDKTVRRRRAVLVLLVVLSLLLLTAYFGEAPAVACTPCSAAS